jgi:AcrR family transcriptional regulator
MARSLQARSVETRARLLDAAAAVIAQHGIEGASVDAISDLAERTSGSLYGQFGSKENLVIALLDRAKDLVADRISTDIAAAEGLDARLAALWRNFVSPPEPAREWLRLEHELWVWATRPGNVTPRQRLSQRYQAEYLLVAETLEAWTAEGLVDPPLPPAQLAPIVVAALIGLEMTHRLHPTSVDEAAAVRALRALLGGAGS